MKICMEFNLNVECDVLINNLTKSLDNINEAIETYKTFDNTFKVISSSKFMKK